MATFTGMLIRDSGSGGKVLSTTGVVESILVAFFWELQDKSMFSAANNTTRVRFIILVLSKEFHAKAQRKQSCKGHFVHCAFVFFAPLREMNS
jgi:hypothetical protein